MQTIDMLTLVIEGKVYSWGQYITGAQAKRLANLSPDVQLYLDAPEPYRDRQIADDERIDLARPGVECFFVKRPLQYTLNSVAYESDRQFVRGRKLRQQGNIADDQQIYLVNKKPWEDEIILDTDWVDLSRPGTEHFVSRPEQIEVTLIVNARQKEWNKRTITYEEVVRLAYPGYNPESDKVYTVVYKKGPVQNPEGTMVAGQSVRVKNKMVFNVTETTRS